MPQQVEVRFPWPGCGRIKDLKGEKIGALCPAPGGDF
jgi:hypothetical protein